MKLAVIGTGYVGLVTGSCFANSGNDVTCVDIDKAKIDALKRGEIPIYEPGLTDLVKRNAAIGRLDFTTDVAAGVAPAELVFLAVGTPPDADGAADLSALWAVAASIAPMLSIGKLHRKPRCGRGLIRRRNAPGLEDGGPRGITAPKHVCPRTFLLGDQPIQ